MAETVTLTTPVTKPSRTTIQIERLQIDVVQKSVFIQWLGNDGEPGSAVYPTPAPVGSAQPTGAVLITQLNKMNFAGVNPSLVNRIITRLQTDGHLAAGTIAGSPDYSVQ